jgi:hypothetical protein
VAAGTFDFFFIMITEICCFECEPCAWRYGAGAWPEGGGALLTEKAIEQFRLPLAALA